MLKVQKIPHNFPIHFPTHFPMENNGKLTSKIVIKNDYVRSDGTCLLYLQIFLNKQKKKFPLNIKINPENFDKNKQRIKPKTQNANDYNLIIEKALADINKIEINYRLTNTLLTMEKLIEEFTNPGARIDFISFWDKEMELQKMKLKTNTYKQQITMLNKLKEYKSKIFFHDINDEFILRLKNYLKVELKNNDNTIASFMKSFKKYLHIANKKGIITPIMHNDVKRGSFTSNRTFLSPDEIIKLNNYYNSEFINPTHKAILARFLFSCFSGLRISDIQKLTAESFIDDILVFYVEKTGKLQRMRLNNSAMSYINPKTIFDGCYTNEYINRELKFISKACNIKKNISFHVARHSFATNFLISGGNIINLQKLLGHSKITDTMIYVHIVESISDIEVFSMDEILKPKETKE